MIAPLLFILSFVMLFMGLYLIDQTQIGTLKTLLQACFFGLFFMLLFTAGVSAFGKDSNRIINDEPDNENGSSTKLEIISKTVKPRIRRIQVPPRK